MRVGGLQINGFQVHFEGCVVFVWAILSRLFQAAFLSMRIVPQPCAQSSSFC